ncbi:unnamed protein product [Psylliodes chrysocephalus]|uniref:Serine carboxypeptidase n=1 Tax=Psylliodes chrysocephalus TaxID=3402493 RepID=A0A9P0GGB1_9CUCU|nr:unnamed protein product [Psylliodes chrysocephala]
MGILDKWSFRKVDKVAQRLPELVEQGKFAEAFGIWRGVEYELKVNTYGVDMYNVLTKKKASASVPDPTNYPGQTGVPANADSNLNKIMNTHVRKALNLTRPWGTQNEAVFDVLTGEKGDFMAPVVDLVETILNNTDIKVAIFTAQFDLICNTPGTIDWINKMNWKDKEDWKASPRVAFSEGDHIEGYIKKSNNFALYWVERSGHMVPADNPLGMYYILKDVTNNFEV